jgi:hypothetical protein
LGEFNRLGHLEKKKKLKQTKQKNILENLEIIFFFENDPWMTPPQKPVPPSNPKRNQTAPSTPLGNSHCKPLTPLGSGVFSKSIFPWGHVAYLSVGPRVRTGVRICNFKVASTPAHNPAHVSDKIQIRIQILAISDGDKI